MKTCSLLLVIGAAAGQNRGAAYPACLVGGKKYGKMPDVFGAANASERHGGGNSRANFLRSGDFVDLRRFDRPRRNGVDPNLKGAKLDGPKLRQFLQSSFRGAVRLN